ncbi:MAG: ribonuclease R [Bacteroidales bacterium]|nr:ribonuclease R [Lachnoclostridium sp.]MCM1383501.1 ribonuclease R [Lachnoclostridium sp.]MCM1464216.1 ribonuclease R [Bacteroidales bacterium]
MRQKKEREKEVLLTGTFLSNVRGFGFVRVEDRKEDIYVPKSKVNGAFHKDIVQIALLHTKWRGREEAGVVKILERGIVTLVGTFEKSNEHYGFVVPDTPQLSKDIFIPVEESKKAVSGHKVVVEITDYGNERRSPEGRITEIIGHVNDPGVDILSIVKNYNLPMAFSDKVMNQVENVAKPVSEADRAGRKDLRDLTMVTIDGEDAKDLDDAVSLSFDGKQYHLGVHIADVTNYVQENSALDREALKRGTSVYLVDRVIPMLPHALSNGICSLNEGEDRLALSCLMNVAPTGEITDYEICETVIRVDRRMTYTAVKKILEDESIVDREPEYAKYASLAPMFRLMEELSLIFREKRRQRGAIDFDFPESRILLDSEGRPIEIKAYERNIATDIIEDFMLAANETVAQHFNRLEIPFVYRTHGVPDKEEVKQLTAQISGFGYYLQGGAAKSVGIRKMKKAASVFEIHPKEFQRLLEKAKGTPEEQMISRLVLRSMKQAVYSVDCTGHFGLACPYYCHFTSPIRRYPDLQIHRIIKEQLRGKMNEAKVEHYKDILPGVAKHSSDTERQADEAERETDKLKKVEYMTERIGQEYEGVISGVTKWGVYVMLPNTVEGMIPISGLPGEAYYFENRTNEVRGAVTGRSFKIGMSVKIIVAACDKAARTIDFELAEEGEGTSAGPEKKTIKTGRGKKERKAAGAEKGERAERKAKKEKEGRTKKSKKAGKTNKISKAGRKAGREEKEREEKKWRKKRKRKD